MLDIQVHEITHEVKKDDAVVGIIPDISLGSYTPLPKAQILCIADEMADLGAERTERLTEQLLKVGIFDAFMHCVKALSAPINFQQRQAWIEQMKAMRLRYTDILNVAQPGHRSTFWDFFQKREVLMQNIAGQVTPIQLMGILMHAHSEYLQTQDDMTRSFLARGILAGVETLNNKKLGHLPQVKWLLRVAAHKKRQEFPYQDEPAYEEDSAKISFGCWYSSEKKPPKNYKRRPGVHYGEGFAARYGRGGKAY